MKYCTEKEGFLRKTISLFTGAMGLDLGLEEAGIETAACVEIDGPSCATIRTNRPSIPVVEGDIRKVEPRSVLDLAGLGRGEAFLVSGGPPCQAFSTAGRRGSFGDPRGSLFADFCRFVEYMRPEYFLMENVRGLLSAAIEHRPLSEREEGHPPLRPEERLGSALEVILAEFDRIGYTVGYKLLNAADYGVPQNRERVILFIGSREGRRVAFPKPTHSKGGIGGLPPWRTLGDALDGLSEELPEYPKYSEERARVFEMVPPGGNWRSLPKPLQKEALGGAYTSTGGRVEFDRRLSFEKASPTIITSVSQKASGMCHPEETRPLSVEECRRVQEFPDGFEFVGSMARKYTQIGNAVPVGLARAVGEAIVRDAKGEMREGDFRGEGMARQLELDFLGAS
jgi:DNA (cytosine-5)-methyltransferase 1